MEIKPIGTIHTPFNEESDTPIQPKAGKGVKATVEVNNEYSDGLVDLAGFSHIILLFHLHLSRSSKLRVTPYLDSVERGVFATRAPSRPNPIGLSVVKLKSVEKNILHIEDVDILDGTPLLDIKPYVPNFDEPTNIKIGWLKEKIHKLPHSKADGRFGK